MNTVTINVDQDAARNRTLALQDGVTQLRRSASALLASVSGEPDDQRVAVLVSARQRVIQALQELAGLG